MTENENENKNKGVLGFFQDAADTVKSTVQNVKLPEVKLPGIKLHKDQDDKKEESEKPKEITTLSTKSVIAIIYYLMMADGRIQEEEKEKFREIGNELDPNFHLYQSMIIDQCNKQKDKAIDPEDEYAVLQDGVEEAIAVGANAKDAVITPKLLVWDLLTIAYSDNQYNEREHQLIKYIVRKLNIDKAVFLEMESSFLTLMDLEKELQWIKTTDRPYLTIESIVNEISDRKTVIFESVKDLIAF